MIRKIIYHKTNPLGSVFVHSYLSNHNEHVFTTPIDIGVPAIFTSECYSAPGNGIVGKFGPVVIIQNKIHNIFIKG